jgi:hypothetical protein
MLPVSTAKPEKFGVFDFPPQMNAKLLHNREKIDCVMTDVVTHHLGWTSGGRTERVSCVANASCVHVERDRLAVVGVCHGLVVSPQVP